MDKLLDKLSSYNILNNLIPGSMYCYLLRCICGINMLNDSVVENLFIYYFVGMIISRFGSIVVEPLAKKIGIINYADYDDYLIASKLDGKIDILLETNNLYRTIASGGLLIVFIKIYIIVEQKISILFYATPYLTAVMLLLLLFLLSFRKQTTYIKKRIDRAIRNKREENAE